MSKRYKDIKLLELDNPNPENGRVYLKEELLEVLEKTEKPLYGYKVSDLQMNVDTPQETTHAAFQVEYLHIRGTELFADILILESPEGKYLQELIDEETTIKYRMVIEGLMGYLDEDTNPVMNIVNIRGFCYDEAWYKEI